MKPRDPHHKSVVKSLFAAMRLLTARHPAAAGFLSAAMLLLAVPLLSGRCALSESGGRLALEELPGQDARLAGVFVTTEPIEPEPPELELDSRGQIVVKDTGTQKIYGSFTGYDAGAGTVTFPGLNGYGIYCLTAPEDETHEATDAKYNVSDYPFANSHYYFSDQEERVETDLYIRAGRFAKYYFNPVYQQTDGQIYLLAGSGVSSDSFVDGQKFSHGLSESVSRTENGEQDTITLGFTVNIIGSALPQETELLLMDEANRPLERYGEERLEELAAAGETLALPEGTAYLVLRQAIEGKEHDSRRLFDRNAETVEYMVPAEDGYLYFRQLPLAWH